MKGEEMLANRSRHIQNIVLSFQQSKQKLGEVVAQKQDSVAVGTLVQDDCEMRLTPSANQKWAPNLIDYYATY